VEELMRRGPAFAGAGALLAAAAVAVAGAGIEARSREARLTPAKAALVAHEERVQAQARREAVGGAKPANPRSLRPRAEPASPPSEGLKELSAPFAPSEYVLDAPGWQDVGVDGITTVFAGAVGSDHERGVVVVMRSTAAGEPVSARAYPAPARSGSLAIAGVRGSALMLRARSGQMLLFDVATGSYVR
jgi:hypothetical protein